MCPDIGRTSKRENSNFEWTEKDGSLHIKKPPISMILLVF